MSSIPTRRTTRITRSAKDTENANARPSRLTATRAKVGLAPSTTRTTATAVAPTHTRATSSTAASKAKALGVNPAAATKDEGKAPKRKREVLVEVTGLVTNNTATTNAGASKGKDKDAAMTKPKAVLKPVKPASRLGGIPALRKIGQRAGSESTTVSRTETETGSKPSDDSHDEKMDIDVTHPTKAATVSADEEESARVFKRRHTEEKNASKLEVKIQDLSQEEADRIAEELHKEEPASSAAQIWDDLDEDDWDDPVMVSEYVADVCIYLKGVEVDTMPNPNYMEDQTEITWEHRGILIDWLLQVHARFNLLSESFFLTVNVLDRFLSMKPISLSKLQLVGLASFFIATKFEETYAPSVKEIAFLADNQYTVEEVLKAERFILKALEWDLRAPGPMGWLRRGSKADECEVRARTVAKYLLEIGCLEPKLIAYVPSQLAAAALWLARLALGRDEWTANLEHYTTYTEKALLPLANTMLEYIITVPVPHESLYKKYAHKKYFRCSTYMQQWSLERWTDNSDVKLEADLPMIKDEIRRHRELLLAEADQEALDQEAV